jgi:spore maturation protein CgeB
VLFVGNTRNAPRPIVEHAIAEKLDPAIYGRGWEAFIPARYIAGQHAPNEALGALYAKATVVLNDHWDDMRRFGFISNRLFDAVAAGASVISDDVAGVAELFGPAVRTYASPAALRGIVSELETLTQAEREQINERSKYVRSAHTFDDRARTIVACVTGLLSGEFRSRAGVN